MSPLDPAGLDHLLNDEELAIRDSVRRFVSDHVLPTIAERFETASHTSDLLPEMVKLGIVGMHLDGYGFAGASAVAYGVVCAELEAGDSSLRQYASAIATTAIHRFGSEEQRDRYLPPMAKGELKGAFALSEPDVGSNPAEIRTRARRDGGDWVIDGTKTWITNGHVADVIVVWAMTDDGVRGFLVDSGTPGLSARTIPHLYSMRTSPTSEVTFESVRVPDSARLEKATSLAAPLGCMDASRFGITWGVTGAARTCFSTAVEYSGVREQFGRPISGFQLTQRKLADMAIALSDAQLRALHVGRSTESGHVTREQVSMAKVANCRAALRVARTALTILGANGTSLEYPVIRHLANLESVATYEGTEEMHTLIVGKALTGVGAFM